MTHTQRVLRGISAAVYAAKPKVRRRLAGRAGYQDKFLAKHAQNLANARRRIAERKEQERKRRESAEKAARGE